MVPCRMPGVLRMSFKAGCWVLYVFYLKISAANHGLGYSLLTLCLGWWGIPWGPIYSIGSLYTNFTGGKDVTQEVLNAMNSGQE